jgi:hypothetical protein
MWVWFGSACAPDALDAPDARDAPGPPSTLFDDVTSTAGVDQVLLCGEPHDKQTILEVNGNGGALVDLDLDGDLDLVLVDGSTRARWLDGRPVQHHIYLNESPPGGPIRFRRHPGDHGLQMNGWPTGITSGDVDRDGRPDLIIGGLGEDALFLNRTPLGSPPRFEKQPLPGRTSPLDWTTSLGLGDADGDGLADLYLVRYLTRDPAEPPTTELAGIPCRFQGHPVLCGPHGLPPQADVFLRGLPDAPWFVPATSEAGLDRVAPAFGLGLLFADFELDGDLDLYVANDSVDNFLFENDGAGHFSERAGLAGVASDMAGRAQAGMGVSLGDVEGDGDLDLVITNFSDEANTLYRQDTPLQFRDVSNPARLALASRPLLGWGVHLADFNADGALDLFFANGHVYPQMDGRGLGTSYRQRNQVLLNQRNGRFQDVTDSSGPGLSVAESSRGAAFGDLDDDGDPDIVVVNLDAPPTLLRNDRGTAMNWLGLVPRGVAGNTDAVGAQVEVTAGDRRQTAEVRAGSGYLSRDDGRILFGLGAAADPGVIEIRWRDGSRQRNRGLHRNQYHHLRQAAVAGEAEGR